MRITANRQVLASALADAAPFVPSKTPLAILKYAKITTKGNRLKVEANNGQDSISRYIDVEECDQDGSFLVNMADFGKFVAATKGERIEIAVDGESVFVKHSKGTAQFSAPPADQFPSVRKPDDEPAKIQIPSAALAEAIANAGPFIGTDDFHPHLCAIYANVEGGMLEYCGTDTRALVAGDAVCGYQGEPVSFYVMPTAFKTIKAMCKGAEAIEVSVTPAAVTYRTPDALLLTAQVKGKFPPYKRVIPKDWAVEMAIDRDSLAESVSRVAMFCEYSRMLKLDASRLSLSVSASDSVNLKQSSETLEHSGCTGEIAIGLDADRLSAMLASFSSGEIKLRFTDCSRPVVFAQESKPSVTALLMPMTLKS